MSRKKTHKEYELELLYMGADCFPVEQYINANVPILHKCIYGHRLPRAPKHVKDGHRCRACSGTQKPTPTEYLSKLKAKGIEHIPLEDYRGVHEPILHRCSKGHEWKASPNSIMSGGHGCPKCMSKGLYNEKFFERNPETANEPGTLYCVVLVDKKTMERVCIKIGMTKGSSYKAVNKRAIGFTGYEVRIQKIVNGTLEEIYHLEQWLHELWSHKKYKSEWKFGGHSELFELDDEIIKSIPSKV